VKESSGRSLPPLLLLLFTCGPARAQPTEAQVLSGSDFAQVAQGPWELGLDFGEAIPARNRSLSHVIDNQRAYDLLAAETVGDEVGEGFVAPPLPGSSVVAGTLRPMPDIGLHVYYRWSPWLSFGFDGGYGIKRNLRVDSPGIYAQRNFLALSYSANIIHFAAPLNVGRSFGPVRAYALAGPGAYWLHERASISFADADDPQLKPLYIVNRDPVYFGLSVGVGLEWRVERGLFGLDFVYHKVYAGADRMDFVLPKLRCAVLF
jgi:hypothetical protein